jgi:putative hydrolase of the HAD superfamily
MIKIISFDFWNTLVQDKHSTLRIPLIQERLASWGHNRTQEEIWDLFTPLAEKLITADRSNGAKHRSVLRILEELLVSLAISVDVSKKQQLLVEVEEVMLQDPPELHAHAKEVVQELAKQYRIGLISDTGITPGRTLRKVLERHDILQYIEFCSFSDETGYCKPHPKAFSPLLEYFHVRPEEVIHVGDLLHTDVAGAKALGIHSIHLNHPISSAHTYVKTISEGISADFEISTLREIPTILQSFGD